MAFLQNESRAKRNLKLLEVLLKFKRTQAEKVYLWVKEIRELTQASDVSVSSEVLKG